MHKIIIRLNFSHLKNETHVQCHENIIGIFERYDPADMGFEPLFVVYKTAYGYEVLALDLIRKSEITEQINVQDRVRDGLFRGLAETIQGSTHHYDPAVATAATLLSDIFKHYGNIARKTLDDETAAINDLLRELAFPAAAAAVTTLNVGAWVTKLTQANATFTDLMTERYQETAAQTPYRMSTTRRDTDRYYHSIVGLLEGQQMVGNHVADALIRDLNAVLERYKRILAQELAERIPPPPPNAENDTEDADEN
ncbi:MAG: DUF6261 family protein [Prevotellaceae bacterium]|nr:DUF6261 family protein [Prevotellaceae bacterium]